MQLAIIGLGRMGMNMAKRLLQGGHQVVAFNRTPNKTDRLVKEGAIGAYSVSEVVNRLSHPRVIWIMLPAGSAVDKHINQLKEILSPNDIVIDGGNTYYKDDIHRNALLAKRGIKFIDTGVSGGIWGLEKGYCLMIGGEIQTYRYLEPIFKTLAPEKGYLYCGGVGAGHFVKMVHNGIEYGMMQALAEGLALLKSREDFDYDLAALSEAWRHGSVVRSWLLDLTAGFLSNDQELQDIAPVVPDSGEGRWTAIEAIDQGVPAPVMTQAIIARFESQGGGDYTAKLLASMRNAFGGHAVLPNDES